ncbi:MAG: thiamine pyrophosphate-dependent dehydrogenase E1 component subunit alpha [Armatimonadetes bacterium]|nr:thiamine pyrophosphate-dependent dehydrogenase E1 component subunit alpha [Armatimonadota bacterium]
MMIASPNSFTITHQLAEHFYAQMLLIRQTEQQFLELFAQGKLNGTVHTCIGQESSAVAVVNAMDTQRDIIFSNHRAHGHFLAYCGDVEGLLAEVLGREGAVCGGIGGTQHLHAGNLYTNGIQGGIAPCATGAALAEKMKRSGAITTVFLGDGTMGQGAVYESMNIAALWQLPILFVLEDNGIAQSTPKQQEHAGDLSTRAQTFGIQTFTADSFDVLALHQTTVAAVGLVRQQQCPAFLVVNCYRLGPHSKGDDTRSPEELAAVEQRDPLRQLELQIDPEQRQLIQQSVQQRIQAAVQDVLGRPFISREGKE